MKLEQVLFKDVSAHIRPLVGDAITDEICGWLAAVTPLAGPGAKINGEVAVEKYELTFFAKKVNRKDLEAVLTASVGERWIAKPKGGFVHFTVIEPQATESQETPSTSVPIENTMANPNNITSSTASEQTATQPEAQAPVVPPITEQPAAPAPVPAPAPAPEQAAAPTAQPGPVQPPAVAPPEAIPPELQAPVPATAPAAQQAAAAPAAPAPAPQESVEELQKRLLAAQAAKAAARAAEFVADPSKAWTALAAIEGQVAELKTRDEVNTRVLAELRVGAAATVAALTDQEKRLKALEAAQAAAKGTAPAASAATRRKFTVWIQEEPLEAALVAGGIVVAIGGIWWFVSSRGDSTVVPAPQES